MCHVRPQKKAIHEVLTFSTTRVGKHHKKRQQHSCPTYSTT